MEEKEKSENNLPEEKTQKSNIETQPPITDDVTQTNIEKEFDTSKIETDATQTDAISTPQPKDRIDDKSNELSSYLRLDEQSKAQIREILQDDLKIAVQDVKKDFFVIFGLFASFVIFISVNIQIFRNNGNIFELIGLSSVFLSFIIVFALIINSIVKGNVEWSDLKKPFYTISILFLVLGILFVSIGNNKTSKNIKELEKKVMNDSIYINQLKSDIKNLNERNKQADTIIFKIKSDIENLKRADTSGLKK